MFLHEICSIPSGHRAVGRARMMKCNARSSGLPLSCSDWLRTSPCPSCGRCWLPFPLASVAGGWPIAATGFNAGMQSQPDSSKSYLCVLNFQQLVTRILYPFRKVPRLPPDPFITIPILLYRGLPCPPGAPSQVHGSPAASAPVDRYA